METLEQIALRVEAIRNGTAHDVTAVLKLVAEFFAELAKQEPVAVVQRLRTPSIAWSDRDIARLPHNTPLFAAPIPTPEDVRDVSRLDWIQSNARCDPMMDGQHKWWPTNFNKCLTGPTLRDAIDAAMTAAQEGK